MVKPFQVMVLKTTIAGQSSKGNSRRQNSKQSKEIRFREVKPSLSWVDLTGNGDAAK